MSSHIVIDVRRNQDFGIGTYIRSLVHALATIDCHNRYTLVTGPDEARALKELPDNFATAIYARTDLDPPPDEPASCHVPAAYGWDRGAAWCR